METLINYSALLGKEISASGWHYDNSGGIWGTIIEIKENKFNYEIFVNKKNELSMSSMTFSKNYMNQLLNKGFLPKSNPFLNTGTDAEIIK